MLGGYYGVSLKNRVGFGMVDSITPETQMNRVNWSELE